MDTLLVVGLHQTVWLMDRLGKVALEKRFSISFQRYLVLAILATLEPATQHQLAICLRYSDGAVSRMLANLRQAGLILSSPDPAHGRKHIVELTPEGRDLVKACSEFLEAKFLQIVDQAGIDSRRYHADTDALYAALAAHKAVGHHSPINKPNRRKQ